MQQLYFITTDKLYMIAIYCGPIRLIQNNINMVVTIKHNLYYL
jgi:hypothetical protein